MGAFIILLQPYSVSLQSHKQFHFHNKSTALLRSNLHLQNLTDGTDLKPLLYTPDRIGNVGLHFDGSAISWSLQVQNTGERRYTVTDYDENWDLVIKDQFMKEFTAVSVSLLYKPPIYDNRFDITLIIENLFDKDIRTLPGYPEPGRTFKLSLGYAQP